MIKACAMNGMISHILIEILSCNSWSNNKIYKYDPNHGSDWNLTSNQTLRSNTNVPIMIKRNGGLWGIFNISLTSSDVILISLLIFRIIAYNLKIRFNHCSKVFRNLLKRKSYFHNFNDHLPLIIWRKYITPSKLPYLK